MAIGGVLYARICITREMVEQGWEKNTEANPYQCPVSVALEKATGLKAYADFGEIALYEERNGQREYRWMTYPPESLDWFMSAFDRGETSALLATPWELTVELEHHEGRPEWLGEMTLPYSSV